MRISRFFIDRPIFAAVLSLAFVIFGLVSYGRLPVAQYPEIAPPVINVTGQYPGASADVVAATVVTPLEQQINGVENMLYVSSNSTGDGRFTIAITFELGTNLDIAQVQVQNRVAIAQPRLPIDVRNIGVTVTKASPDLMMVVHLYSPDKSRDTLFISNYASFRIIDVLNRINGVGSISVFGGRDYSMRIWLDPDRLQSLGLTTGDVVTALQGQNVQVASGVLSQPPVDQPRAFQVAVQTLGRLADPDAFANILVKQTPTAVVRLKDVARVELAALDYSTNSYLDRDPAVALGIFQLPGSNALATAQAIKSTMDDLAKDFPDGLKYAVVYNPTEFIQQSVDAVVQTIGEAAILVVLVVILFLQTWRAAVIPILAIPVSLIGTFFFMAMFGFSLNNLSLFGLVLAIGIVVDDAIVVVENVERNIATGLSPREAAHRSMSEVGSALIAIALVLCAVFVPAAFITGISGQFYRQFALTIAGATIISLIVSLTLSPALCALLLKPHVPDARSRWWLRPVSGFFARFNRGFDVLARGYGRFTARVVRFAVLMLALYAAVIGYGLNEFRKTPAGFIPQLDAGYLIVVTQLPSGASLARTDAVNRQVVDLALAVPGIAHAVNFAGFSGATFTNAPNSGAIFLTLDPFAARARDPSRSAAAIQAALFQRFAAIQEGLVVVVSAAARARHRHLRRVPHDGGRSRRRRPAGVASCRLRHDGPRRRNARPHAGILVVRSIDTTALSRHRSHQGAAAGCQHDRRVRCAADVSRLHLRQRLQSARPRLPRHCAGGRSISTGCERRAEDSRSWHKRGNGPPWLVHDGTRRLRSLPRAALQSLPGRRARRRARARFLARASD